MMLIILEDMLLNFFLKQKFVRLIPDFFDFDNSKTRKLPVSKTKRIDKDNLYKPFKVHDYEQLLILSGLYTEFSNKIIIYWYNYILIKKKNCILFIKNKFTN